MKYLLIGQTIDCEYIDTFDVFNSKKDLREEIENTWDTKIDDSRDMIEIPLCNHPEGLFADQFVYKVFPYKEKYCVVINRGDSTEGNTEDYECLYGNSECELCQKASDTIRKLFGKEQLKETFNSFKELKIWEENADDDMFNSDGWNLRVEIFE